MADDSTPATMDSWSTTIGNTQQNGGSVTMGSDGWGAQANLPWLKDSLNSILNETGVTSLVDSALQQEANVVIPVANEIGSAIGNAMSDVFGGVGGFNLGGGNSAVYKITPTGAGYTETINNGRVSFTDTTTGKTYNSIKQMEFAQGTDKYAQGGYPTNVAQMMAAADIGILPQATLDKITEQVKSLGNPSAVPTNVPSSMIGALYSLYTPGANTDISRARDATLASLTQPGAMTSTDVISQIKKQFGTLPPDVLNNVRTTLVENQDATKAEMLAKNPNLAQYFQPNATMPAVGTKDAYDLAAATHASADTLNKLMQAYQASTTSAQNDAAKATADKNAATEAARVATVDTANKAFNTAYPNFTIPFPNATTDEQRAANMQASYQQTHSASTPTSEDTQRLQFLLGMPDSVDTLVAAYKAEGNTVTPYQQTLIDAANAKRSASAAATVPAPAPAPTQWTPAYTPYKLSDQSVAAIQAQTAQTDQAAAAKEQARVAAGSTPDLMAAKSAYKASVDALYNADGTTKPAGSVVSPSVAQPAASKPAAVGTPAEQRLQFLMSLGNDPTSALTEYQNEGFTLTPDQQAKLNPANTASTMAQTPMAGVQLGQSPMASADPTKVGP